MIRKAKTEDSDQLYFIINEAAKAHWDIPRRHIETSVVLGIEIARLEENR